VTRASTGRQALRVVERNAPGLVILDMFLPDMEGTELMKALRRGLPGNVPVLFISADTDIDRRLAALDSGAEDFLIKPVSLRELNTRIENALRRNKKTRNLEATESELRTRIDRGQEHYEQATRELKRQLLAMRTLISVSQDLNRVLDPEELVNVVSLTLIGELRISSMAMFSLVSEGQDAFHLLGMKGFNADKFDSISIARSSRFVKALEGEVTSHKLARNPDRRWMLMLPDLRLAVFEYVTPINVKGETKGLIFSGPKIAAQDYNEYDLDMLMFIANSAGIGMENARLLKELHKTYVSTLKTMVSIIEAKDAYTRGHTERVASYAMAIAKQLTLSEEMMRRIMFGALLHDIGKLGVVDSIIHKKGKLDEREWEALKIHPSLGSDIVEKMEFLTGVSEIVRHHHESWDGRGYPDGVRAREIPLGARVVAVADAFDAMTTDRSYRRALSTEQAIQRLEASAGTQFDPGIVRVFVRHIRSKGYDLVVASDPSGAMSATAAPATPPATGTMSATAASATPSATDTTSATDAAPDETNRETE